MATTTSTPAARSGARVRVQKFGTFLSNMVLPNIGAFIAWGLITALFIENGWLNLGGGDNAWLSPDSWVAEFGGWGDFAGGGVVGPMITYLLPLLIGYTGGRMMYDNNIRGGVVGAIATMGAIAGAERADVPRRDDHGPARRLVDEEARRPLGRTRSARASRCWSTTSPPASGA